MKRSTRSAPGSGFVKSTNCSEPAGTVRTPRWKLTRAHCWMSSLAAGEVDAVDAADAPLGIRQAARVAVHDRVVGHARAERVVLRAVGVGVALALLLLVRALTLLGAALARRGRADLHGVARDLAAARVLGQLLELVGGLVDRLQVALVLELPPGRRDVWMPHLGEPAPRELDVALVERRLDLKEQDRLLDVQHLCHEQAYGSARAEARRCLPGPPGRISGVVLSLSRILSPNFRRAARSRQGFRSSSPCLPPLASRGHG